MNKTKINRKEVETKIVKTFSSFYNASFDNYSVSTMDSLDKCEFFSYIENEFDIEIPNEKIFPFPKTTDEIVDKVIKILKENNA